MTVYNNAMNEDKLLAGGIAEPVEEIFDDKDEDDDDEADKKKTEEDEEEEEQQEEEILLLFHLYQLPFPNLNDISVLFRPIPLTDNLVVNLNRAFFDKVLPCCH